MLLEEESKCKILLLIFSLLSKDFTHWYNIMLASQNRLVCGPPFFSQVPPELYNLPVNGRSTFYSECELLSTVDY
jgi:hypothetical protein